METVIILIILVLLLVGLCFYNKAIDGFSDFNFTGPRINPPWTLNTELNQETYKIAKAIINNINKKINKNYVFGQFENVIEDNDIEGNKRYIMDFFVYEINNQNVNDVNRRIIVDLTLFYKTKTIQVNTVNFSNALKNQEVNNDSKANKDALILKHSLLANDNQPMRFTFKEVLESDPFENPKTIDLGDTDRRPWILPVNIQDKANLRAFPCQDYGNWWDENGIPLTYEEENGLPKKQKPKWCYNSYNTATVPQTIVGQRYPSFVKMPYDQANKANNWMFDKMQGIVSFPHGGSNSGRS